MPKSMPSLVHLKTGKTKESGETLRLKREGRQSRDFWQEKTKEIAIKPRQFFQTFKPFISNKCKDERNIHIKINDRVEKDQRIVAEEFAEYFSTMVKADSAEEKDFHDHPSVKAIRKANENTSFQFRLMTVGEVTKELTNLNIKKTSGWDMLPSKVLKLSSETLAPSITKLYNNCIEQSMWPTKWKKGEWIPVFKRDNRQERTNYRPITVLPVIGKVFESLLSKQMTESYNPYLYSKLTAYRKTHSCETTLIGLTEEWRQAADRKENVVVLSTDMSKAFDSLHPSLMIKSSKHMDFVKRRFD